MRMLKLNSIRIAASLIFLVSLFCCSSQAANEAEVGSVVESSNTFALDLYQNLRKKDGNLFFSPYSISTALAMTYAGARGSTEQQMAEVLKFNLEQPRLHAAFGSLESQLGRVSDREEGIELSVANALWLQKDHVFLKDFLRLTQKNYRAGFNYVDFVQAHEAAREEINAWVKKKTNDKIHDLIPPDLFHALTRLVLTNAIYFKGTWEKEFKKARTEEEPFWLEANRSVDIPMMRQQRYFPYWENDNLQILELPYVGEELSMIVLLPRKIDGLEEIEEALTLRDLNAWQGSMDAREVLVVLPRFRVESQFSLKETLSSMGMSEAFIDGIADFSGLDGTKELHISAVVHKAYVDVNEEGTEAAAATAVEIGRVTAVPPLFEPLVFRADHPFIFLIRHNPSGSILFLGRLKDPRNKDESYQLLPRPAQSSD